MSVHFQAEQGNGNQAGLNMENSNMDISVIIIGGTAILLILLFFIITLLFLFKNRQVNHKLEIVQVTEAYNQEILRAQLEIREQTLKNISEDIHDNVGQILSLVTLNLSALDFKDEQGSTKSVEDALILMKKAVTDLRNLSKTLDSSNIAKLGLAATIRFDVEFMGRTNQFHTGFEVKGKENPLDSSREIIVYRLVQEALNNVMKHSQAKNVEVLMNYTEEHLCLEITDDGKGFDPSVFPGNGEKEHGAGFNNMRKRAQMVGAELRIYSEPSKGTRIEFRVPYH
jgi:two-component system NarL family sensor kinase